MHPRTESNFDPMAERSPDPFSELRTIPGAWDVSAFYAPERENWRHYRLIRLNTHSKGLASSPHVYAGEEEG